MRKIAAVAALVALATAPAALAGPNLRVGAVDDGAVWGDPAAQMDLARLAGFDTVRMTAQWSGGMTKLPQLQMARIQQAAMLATIRGIQPVVSIYNASGASTPADPVSRAEFVQFAASVVVQLPWVTTFIVGNEPNSNLYWQPQFDATGGDAAAVAYEQLLADTYDAIKAVRPDVTVVGGALDSRGTDDPTAQRLTHSPTAFIQDIGAAYRASGRTRPIMDVFDEHIYEDNSTLPPSMPHAASSEIAEADYAKLVSLLGKAFDGTAQPGSTLPILYGEFGVETAVPADKASLYSGTQVAPTVDEATQAAYYVEAMKLALCQPNVIGLLLFHVEDESALSGWQSGVFYPDGTAKASLPAIQAATAAVHDGTLTHCPDQTAPTVSMQVGNGTITAAAADDVGVGEVQLLVNGKVADVDYTAPYTFPWKAPRSGAVVEVRALDAAGNAGTASLVVGARRLAGVRGTLARGSAGTFSWRAPKSGRVTFRARRAVQVYAGDRQLTGRRVSFAAKRGIVYAISVAALPLTWAS